ncbi:MAG: acetate--CoA ligase family protein [Gammaproteobacteria bacterium]|nr:acetate--CoA ligase family protein [Gammaproteobacteria bacterium]
MNIETVVKQARAEGRSLLNEIEAKELLHDAGIPVAQTVLVTTEEEARTQAEKIGYPVVLKIVSPDISHKSDIGGVRVGLDDSAAVTAAFNEIIANANNAVPDASITGIAVQRMAPAGTEVIVGMTTDPQFGPVIMFGLGGVMVEVLKDVSFRVVPLDERDAAQMIDEIKGKAILDGVRGQPAADKVAIKRAILKVAEFVERNPDVRELDLNPMLVYPDGAIAVDARIVIFE